MIRFLYPAALSVLVLLVGCSGDEDRDASPTLTTSPTPSAGTRTPTPSVTTPLNRPELLSDVPIDVLRVGEDLRFPPDVAIITLLGCTNCDGPAYGIGRIYRDEPEGVVVEPLMWTSNSHLGLEGPENSLGLPAAPANQNRYAIIGAAADPTGAEIIAGVCCVGGSTILYRSTDGGITWAIYLEMAGAHSPYLIVGPGRVLVGPYAFGGQVPYQIVPGGEVIQPPEGALWPTLIDGEVAWIADGGESIRTSDAVLIDASDPGDVTLYAPVFGPERGVMTIYQYQSQGYGADYYLAELNQDYSIARAYRSPDAYVGEGFWLDNRQYFTLAPFLQDSDRIAGQPYVGSFSGLLVPAIIDMETGEVHGIAEVAEASQALSARGILSLRTGSFARVAGTGTCLNVRAAATTYAEVLACAADNVLLTVVEPDQPGSDWLHIMTPGGVVGFVSRDYIELIRQ